MCASTFGILNHYDEVMYYNGKQVTDKASRDARQMLSVRKNLNFSDRGDAA